MKNKKFNKLSRLIFSNMTHGSGRASLGFNLAYEKKEQYGEALQRYCNEGIYALNAIYEQRNYYEFYIMINLLFIQESVGFRIFGKAFENHSLDWIVNK